MQSDDRWLDASNFDPHWSPRSAIAAKLIGPDARAVCDIGCGMQTLRTFLPANVSYLPADLKQWTEDTEVCDINGGRLPERSIAASDCCVALGLFEYITDPVPLIQFISRSRKRLVTTYNTLENTPNRYPTWKTHFTGQQFLNFARYAGFNIVDVRLSLGTELMFVFEPQRDTA